MKFYAFKSKKELINAIKEKQNLITEMVQKNNENKIPFQYKFNLVSLCDANNKEYITIKFKLSYDYMKTLDTKEKIIDYLKDTFKDIPADIKNFINSHDFKTKEDVDNLDKILADDKFLDFNDGSYHWETNRKTLINFITNEKLEVDSKIKELYRELHNTCHVFDVDQEERTEYLTKDGNFDHSRYPSSPQLQNIENLDKKGLQKYLDKLDKTYEDIIEEVEERLDLNHKSEIEDNYDDCDFDDAE